VKDQGQPPNSTIGICEVLALAGEISWNGGSVVRDLITAPIIVEKGNASCFYGAIHDAMPAIGGGGLARICSGQKCVMGMELPDGVKYVQRMIHFKAALAPRNYFDPDITCAVHRLHRIIVLSLREDDIVGDDHAIAFVSGLVIVLRELKAF
jgi:hypothetical protein